MSWNESEKLLKLNGPGTGPLQSFRLVFLDFNNEDILITPEERFKKDLEEIRIFIYGE